MFKALMLTAAGRIMLLASFVLIFFARDFGLGAAVGSGLGIALALGSLLCLVKGNDAMARFKEEERNQRQNNG